MNFWSPEYPGLMKAQKKQSGTNILGIGMRGAKLQDTPCLLMCMYQYVYMCVCIMFVCKHMHVYV